MLLRTRPAVVECHHGTVPAHPQLIRIEATEDPSVYTLTLVVDGGGVERREFGLDLSNPDEPVCDRADLPMTETWHGDAESIRSLVAATVSFHKARWYGRDLQS